MSRFYLTYIFYYNLSLLSIFVVCLPMSLMCLHTEPFSAHKESIKSSLKKVNMHERRGWRYSALPHPAL